MNAAKVTLTSTVLAAAFGLALGLMSAPGDTYACHKEGGSDQKDCGDGEVCSFSLMRWSEHRLGWQGTGGRCKLIKFRSGRKNLVLRHST